MYQLVMALIAISVFAGLLMAGRTYIDPQAVIRLRSAEELLAAQNRINLALLSYRIANDAPVLGSGWEDAIEPYLDAPLDPLPVGHSWNLQGGPEAVSACLATGVGITVPPSAASVACP